MLATLARRVKIGFDVAPEDDLLSALHATPGGDHTLRRELGSPDTIVLQTEVVATLAARLRRAPWVAVATQSCAGNDPVLGTRSALRLLSDIFRTLRFGTAFASKSAPRRSVLAKLLRQV